jgi:Na+/proline symporter
MVFAAMYARQTGKRLAFWGLIVSAAVAQLAILLWQSLSVPMLVLGLFGSVLFVVLAVLADFIVEVARKKRH